MPTSSVLTHPSVQMANTDAGIHAANTGPGGRVVATLIVSVEGSSAFAPNSPRPIFATNGTRRPRTHRRPKTGVGATATIALVTVALLVAVAIVSALTITPRRLRRDTVACVGWTVGIAV